MRLKKITKTFKKEKERKGEILYGEAGVEDTRDLKERKTQDN